MSQNETKDDSGETLGGSPETLGPIRETLAEVMARATPAFGPCGKCGELTSGPVCFDCSRKADKLVGVREKTMEAVPEFFRGVTLRSEKLLKCVGGRRALIARAQAAVGATRVLLLGHSGSGKTSLAVAMMQEWASTACEAAVFAMATDLATAKSRGRFGTEADEIAKARDAKLLVVDEFGSEEFRPPSSPVTDMLFGRHAKARPTWITTWLGSDRTEAFRRLPSAAKLEKAMAAVGERYGDGISRRLFEGARIIECWESE